MKKIFLLSLLIPAFLFSCASNSVKKSGGESAFNEPMAEDEVSTMASAPAQEKAFYTIKSGDTLMWIAFQVYGDYERWRDLVQENPDKEIRNLEVGDTIAYTKPAEEFVWVKNGTPYLINSGETLGSISQKLYNTTTRWRDLYENNRQMIKDPNLIFAGFTLYYRKGIQLTRLYHEDN